MDAPFLFRRVPGLSHSVLFWVSLAASFAVTGVFKGDSHMNSLQKRLARKRYSQTFGALFLVLDQASASCVCTEPGGGGFCGGGGWLGGFGL